MTKTKTKGLEQIAEPTEDFTPVGNPNLIKVARQYNSDMDYQMNLISSLAPKGATHYCTGVRLYWFEKAMIMAMPIQYYKRKDEGEK
ncbi:hypothetical protein HYX17_05235 [Candidatus Woesearchaeota archaeon]|nr:hypothetical protein [Candidatus Woesearchaeota archaeon]